MLSGGMPMITRTPDITPSTTQVLSKNSATESNILIHRPETEHEDHQEINHQDRQCRTEKASSCASRKKSCC